MSGPSVIVITMYADRCAGTSYLGAEWETFGQTFRARSRLERREKARRWPSGSGVTERPKRTCELYGIRECI